MAAPEKALLDLIYLQASGDAPLYLDGLRLQNLHILNLDDLQRQAELAHSPKLQRAAERVTALAGAEALAYENL